MTRERLLHELREVGITTLYLFVWLVALELYESALLHREGVSALPLGVAAGKALVLGKFVLIGEGLGAGTRIAARSVLQRIAWRSLGLLAVLVALHVLEEFVVGLVHGRSAAETVAELGARPVLELAARCVLMLLVLVPFVAAKQVGLALGPGGLRRLLSARPGDEASRSS